MAVAVKTSGARSGSPTVSPAILSLIGVVYLIACLWVIFKGVPWLWWTGFERAGLAGRFSVELGTLLVLVALAVGVGLLVLGGRLLRPYPSAGVRGGVFLGFVGLLLILGLARWATIWIEYWCYDKEWFGPTTGIILSAAVAGVLLLAGLCLFFTARAQRWTAALEAGGWFQATAYKSNQGQKVRRATILGILLLIGAGVWTLVSHGSLRRGAPDWSLSIPFTGRVAIEDMGDTPRFLIGDLDPDKKSVEILTPGKTEFRPGQVVSAADYIKAVTTLVKADEKLDAVFPHALEVARASREKEAKDKDSDITAYLMAVNQVIGQRMREVLNETGPSRTFESPAAVNRLNALFPAWTADELERRSRMAIAPAVRGIEREAEAVKKKDNLGPAFSLPTGALLVGQYALRDINSKLDPSQNVRVGVPSPQWSAVPENPKFKEFASATDFGRAEVRVLARDPRVRATFAAAGKADKLKELEGSAADGEAFKRGVADELTGELAKDANEAMDNIPVTPKQNLTFASGPTTYASIPLLPTVKYTVPVLLLLLSLWLAWRVVNMPTFADFLIATEAEMNKVSWTTQRRLVQDTIVVLVTVVLMAVFLFVTDYTWKVILGWEPIGVLYIPDQKDKDAKQSVEQKRW